MRQFAVEASQSPQLMQAICLQVCFTLKQYDATTSIIERSLSAPEVRAAYEETSNENRFCIADSEHACRSEDPRHRAKGV